jgi:PAS domain S-box-containing protein
MTPPAPVARLHPRPSHRFWIAATAAILGLAVGGALIAVAGPPISGLAVLGALAAATLLGFLAYRAAEPAPPLRASESEGATKGPREGLFESIVEAVEFGILVAESDRRLLVANPAARQMLGLRQTSTSEAWVRTYGVYRADGVTPYPPDELPLERALRGETVDAADFFIRTPRRTEGIWVSASARPLPDSPSGRRRAVVAFHDVTARRLTEEFAESARLAAEAASTAKQQFLSRLSHDLRTPLNAIVGFAGLLGEGTQALSGKQKRFADHILTASEELLRKIGGVLELSQAAAAKTRLDYQPCDLMVLIEEVCVLLEPLAGPREIQVVSDDGPESLWVTVDEARLKRSLAEVVANAIQHSHHGGHVSIAVVRMASLEEGEGCPSTVRITVEDRGDGVSLENQEAVFDTLGRRDASYAAEDQNGIGVGLALARRLVELHGGWVWLESEGKNGRGTRVYLEIPEAPAELREGR